MAEEREWAGCLRLVSQSAGRDSSVLDASADAAILDAVKKLQLMCKRQGNADLITKVYPSISKLFQRCCSSALLRPSTTLLVLEILQFFLDHGEAVLHDADPSLRAFLRSCLSRQYADPTVAAATVNFFNKNATKMLLYYPTLLPQYFPLLLKIIAWGDDTLDESFLKLLPLLMAPSSFLPLFPALLDLPTLVLALESLEQRSGSLLLGSSITTRKNPAPEALLALMDEAYTGTSIDRGDEQDMEGLSTAHFEADNLFSDLLKDENEGLAERHWSYPGAKATLEATMGGVQSQRLKHAINVTHLLLDIYFQIALRDVNESLLCALLPMIFLRVDAMFPDKKFSKQVEKRCFEFMHAAFEQSPHFIAVLKKPIADRIGQPQTSPGKTELALQLCWAIGEHGGGGVGYKDAARELFETLELLLYENLTSSRMTRSALLPAQARLLCFIISAIAKLATCHRELSPRARVCLAKVARSHHVLDKIVWKRARNYLGVMHEGGVSYSLLGGKEKIREGNIEWCDAAQQSVSVAVAHIPFYIFAERQGPPLHDFKLSNIL